MWVKNVICPSVFPGYLRGVLAGNSNFLQLYSTQMTELLEKLPSKLFQVFLYLNINMYIYILKISDLNSQSLLDLHDLFDLKFSKHWYSSATRSLVELRARGDSPNAKYLLICGLFGLYGLSGLNNLMTSMASVASMAFNSIIIVQY